MFELSNPLVAFAAGGLAVGLVMWLAMRVSRLEQENAQLRQKQQAGPGWAQELRLDHRQQLVSIGALIKLSTRDNLDALSRMDPAALKELVAEFAPHLFQKDDIK